MKKACLYVHSAYQDNEVFKADSPLNRDQCLSFFSELKKTFLKQNYELLTQDKCTQEEADFIIFNEMPTDLSLVKYPKKSYLFLFESELIRPDDWKIENHHFFSKIFTWNDDWVNNEKYFKFNFSHAGIIDFKAFSDKSGFCTLIAGNKKVDHPLELYSKRVEAIRWFEKNQLSKFNFYGMGWDLHTFQIPFISKVFNRMTFLRKLFAQKWPAYKGSVESKLSVLQNYKFSVCYENAHGITGYITEKILDSLAAGCVPIYWGAPNISDFIPKNCYIDKTDFSTYEELFVFLDNISEVDYNLKLANIRSYLESEKHHLFEPAYNAKKIVEIIINA